MRYCPAPALWANPRTRFRIAALVAPYTGRSDCGRVAAVDPVRMIDAPGASREQRQRLLHGEQRALDIGGEHGVELLFGDPTQRGTDPDPSVGDQDVDPARLLGHRRVEPVKILKPADVATDSGHPRPKRGLDLVELRLATAGHEDLRALGVVGPCDRQSDARVRPGNHCDLAFQHSHGIPRP